MRTHTATHTHTETHAPNKTPLFDGRQDRAPLLYAAPPHHHHHQLTLVGEHTLICTTSRSAPLVFGAHCPLPRAARCVGLITAPACPTKTFAHGASGRLAFWHTAQVACRPHGRRYRERDERHERDERARAPRRCSTAAFVAWRSRPLLRFCTPAAWPRAPRPLREHFLCAEIVKLPTLLNSCGFFLVWLGEGGTARVGGQKAACLC